MLQKGLRELLWGRFFMVIERWGNKALGARDSAAACVLQAHLALLCKNVTAASLDYRAVSTLMVAQVYLTNFYAWDVDATPHHHGALPGAAAAEEAAAAAGGGDQRKKRKQANVALLIPQTEVLQVFQAHRNKCLAWLDAHDRLADEVMEAIERVVSYAGVRRRADGNASARGWQRVGNNGRFVPETEVGEARASRARTEALAAEEGYVKWYWRVCNEAVDTEINVELGEFTIKRNRMQLVPLSMGAHDDYAAILGPMDPVKRPQCAVVRTTAEREHVRLLAARHDLLEWTADPRPIALPWARPYPSGLAAAEGWALALLAPLVGGVFAGFELSLPPQPPADPNVVRLAALRPAAGKGKKATPAVLRELVVTASPPLVLAFAIESAGRVWYRRLVFTSDADASLHAPAAVVLKPDPAGPRPPALRGDVCAATPEAAPSLRVARNLSASLGAQTNVARRFLRGLLPDALLEQFDFWQADDDDALHGFETPATRALLVRHSRLHVPLARVGGGAGGRIPNRPSFSGMGAALDARSSASGAGDEAHGRVLRLPLLDTRPAQPFEEAEVDGGRPTSCSSRPTTRASRR